MTGIPEHPDIQSELCEPELDQSDTPEIIQDESGSYTSENEFDLDSPSKDGQIEVLDQSEAVKISPCESESVKITKVQGDVPRDILDQSEDLKIISEESKSYCNKNSETDVEINLDQSDDRYNIIADNICAQKDQTPKESDQLEARTSPDLYYNESYHESETVIVDDLNELNQYSQSEPEVDQPEVVKTEPEVESKVRSEPQPVTGSNVS